MEIDSKLKQTQGLRHLVTNVTATLSDMPGSPSRTTDKMERIIARIIDMERKIDEDIDALVDLKEKIQNLINSLDDAEYRVLLTERYINFEDWEKKCITAYGTSISCMAGHCSLSRSEWILFTKFHRISLSTCDIINLPKIA